MNGDLPMPRPLDEKDVEAKGFTWHEPVTLKLVEPCEVCEQVASEIYNTTGWINGMRYISNECTACGVKVVWLELEDHQHG